MRIVIDLNFLPATAAETNATYQELRDYILTAYGLHVSNLYISQIKHKCGLDMRPNYNLPKSENSRVPTCPPDKEMAIMEALRHFKMI